MSIFILVAAAFLAARADAPSLPAFDIHKNAVTEYVWTRLTPAAPFARSYNFQLFADSVMIRAFHQDGVWMSTDGASWQKTALSNIVGGQAFLDYVRFNGAIYALGTFAGNIERFTITSQVSRTRDLRSWEIVARTSELPRRFFYHPFVFRNKLWIIGGRDEHRTYADAWTSTDAVHWSKIADDLPFGARDGQQFTIFRDSLYMLDRDVWVSGDGVHWRLVAPRIAHGEIFGAAVEVFDGRIWLLGCNRSGTFRSEVLSSSDGITWSSDRAPWSPRGGAASCQFKGRIILTGGKYGGPGIRGQTEFVYSNDVWAMGRK